MQTKKGGIGSNQWIRKPPSVKTTPDKNKTSKLPEIALGEDSASGKTISTGLLQEKRDSFLNSPNRNTAYDFNKAYLDICENILKDF